MANYTKLELKQKELIREAHKLLLDNNLKTDVIYKLITNFHDYGLERFFEGMEQQKNI